MEPEKARRETIRKAIVEMKKQNIIGEMYILSGFKALYAFIITNSSCHVESNFPKIILKMPENGKYPQSNGLDSITCPEKSFV
jgi:hypothetical protein